jgi:cytidylate kinase
LNGCVNSIAIDGPAASGKSTIAQLLAERIGYLFFDTGVMYRAVTYAALERELDLDDHAAVTRLTHALDLDIRPPTADDERQADVFIDGIDHTWDIRLPRVDAHVSRVAAIPGVRDSLGEQQRKIGLRGGVVMVGRDIGTVVLPEACFKVYLDASVEERAHRRFQENEERGEQGSYEQVLADMRKRDRIDSSRDIAPLRPAEDAVILNSDGQTIDAVVEQIVAIFEAKSNGESH